MFVGDTVTWQWKAPVFQNVAYRVFAVPSPSSTTYEGGVFNSGDTSTSEGRTWTRSLALKDKPLTFDHREDEDDLIMEKKKLKIC